MQNSSNHQKTTSKKLLKSPKLKRIIKILALPAWVIVAIILSEYISVYSLYFLIGREKLTTPLWTTILNALVYSLALLATIFLPPLFYQFYQTHFKKSSSHKQKPTVPRFSTTREQLGLKNLPTWTDILLAPAGFIAYFILALILTTLFSFLPFFDLTEVQDVGYNLLNTGFDRLLAFLALVIIAPIAEEIIFRGWLYGKLRANISGSKSLLISILITSLVFAIVHGQWNVGVNVFAMSIILCLMREVTGTVYSGILLHMLKNGIAFVMLYIML